MDRQSIAEIIRYWYAEHNGHIPKGRSNEQKIAMSQLIEKMLEQGHEIDDIKSTRVADLVLKAAVHQGPITLQMTKQKRDSWTYKVKDDWDIVVRQWKLKLAEQAAANLIREEADLKDLENEKPVSSSVESTGTDSLRDLIPEEPLINEEMEEFFRKHSNE